MDAEMEDARVAEAQDNTWGEDGPLPLSDKESRILDLYDQLTRLEFEVALQKELHRATIDPSENVAAQDVINAQDRLLEARASWMLRSEVAESVMVNNPILKAVHRGTDSTPIERDLLPFVEHRDEVTTSLAKRDMERQKVNNDLAKVQVEAMHIGRRNIELAAEVLKLAETANQNKAEALDDAETREEVERLEQELKASRQKWKVIKGTASAVVAGSGVDWVKDAELRDIVLDPA
ncbi:centromere protein H (CENP-H)-domain-containing protein [Coniochaeta sp. 2T2.1]|nr:centromere protein H (CENP-H)-domain-containing protein [Coniochaeta sp. 2T2.1]